MGPFVEVLQGVRTSRALILKLKDKRMDHISIEQLPGLIEVKVEIHHRDRSVITKITLKCLDDSRAGIGLRYQQRSYISMLEDRLTKGSFCHFQLYVRMIRYCRKFQES